MKLLNLFIRLCFLILIVSGCKKEPEPNSDSLSPTPAKRGLLIVNEGLFNSNNSTITHFDIDNQKATTDFFELKNNRRLGDTGNDIAVYGSKIYVIVNVSSQIEVLNFDGVVIQQIPLFDGQVARQPRNIAFYENKAYVCSFDGTVAVIDTATLQVNKYIQVGRNPEDITVQNNKIYVSNSGGLDSPNYDSTVSVIDPVQDIEIKKINVRMNPGAIQSDNYGEVYVISRGDYGTVPARLLVIDADIDSVVKNYDIDASGITIYGDIGYVNYYDFTNQISQVSKIDVQTDVVVDEHFLDVGTIETLHGLAVDPYNGDIYCTDAHGFINTGEVICYDSFGVLKFSFTAGLNPGHFAFFNQ